MAETYTFVLNGKEVEVQAEPKTSSLEVLREHLGIHTCKAGCSPQGLCGCCTALIDGKARLTCTLPVKSLLGKSVTTMDGVPEADRALIAESFVRAGGTQCGYCTPGIVLNTWSVLQANASPTPEEWTRALNQHLCRCTGYTAIYQAMERAAAVRRGDPDPLPPRLRFEGVEVALGDRPYVDDLERPGLLLGGVVFAPVAAGTVDEVDVEAARAVPGVVAVQVRRPAGSTLAHAGEVVVALAAETPQALREATRLVAVKATAAPVAGLGEAVADGRRVDGDVDAALAAAAHRVADTFTFAATDPVYLEPEAALAVPVAGGLHVYSPGHDADAEARALSAELGVPVRVFLVPSGGSYGGKEAPGVQGLAGALALQAGRPVRLSVTMEEGMRLHPRRPAAEVRAELGCDATGRLTALKVEARFDGGAVTHAADRLVAQALGAFVYEPPALAVAAEVRRSGNPATGPIRGGGAVAVVTAVEALVDRLAHAAGLDPLALRARNVTDDAAAVLAALAPHRDGAEGPTGLALARMDGSGGARVVLRVVAADEIEVSCNVPELGQGRDEVLLEALVGATGLAPDTFTITWADSTYVGRGALAQSPVDLAAWRAGQALRAAGGALAGLVGRAFVGEDQGRAPANVAGTLVVLAADGAVESLLTAVGAGTGQDARLVANLAEGAAHMGLGLALSEEIATTEGLAEGRLRFLGVLKPKGLAGLEGLAVPLGSAPRDISEVAVCAPPAAVLVAVQALEGQPRTALPMKDSAAARALGVRAPKK